MSEPYLLTGRHALLLAGDVTTAGVHGRQRERRGTVTGTVPSIGPHELQHCGKDAR